MRRAETELRILTEILAAVTESLAAFVDRGDWKEAFGRLLRSARIASRMASHFPCARFSTRRSARPG